MSLPRQGPARTDRRAAAGADHAAAEHAKAITTIIPKCFGVLNRRAAEEVTECSVGQGEVISSTFARGHPPRRGRRNVDRKGQVWSRKKEAGSSWIRSPALGAPNTVVPSSGKVLPAERTPTHCRAKDSSARAQTEEADRCRSSHRLINMDRRWTSDLRGVQGTGNSEIVLDRRFPTGIFRRSTSQVRTAGRIAGDRAAQPRVGAVPDP